MRRALKVIITLVTVGFLIGQIWRRPSWTWDDDFWYSAPVYLPWTGLLAVFNWFIATIQWKILQPQLTFRQSINQLLSGHFAGLHTPLKVGDAWARSGEGVSRHRGMEAFATHAFLLAAIGLVASVLILLRPVAEIRPYLPLLVCATILIISALFVFTSRVLRWSSFKFFQVGACSIARVIIFELAAALLFQWADPEIIWHQWLVPISVVYAGGSLIPIGSFFDFALRASLMQLFFPSIIVSVGFVTAVFFIHSAIHSYLPALIGGWQWWRNRPLHL